MLELLVLRHAKAMPDEGGLGDQARDLDPSGIQAAAAVGELMRTQGLIPDLVLCSSATRTQRTWELVQQALGTQVPSRSIPELYLAPPAGIMGLVQGQPTGPGRLLIVGHNPGLHAFARRLVGAGSRELAAEMPTAALARIGLEVAAWSEAAPGKGRLLGYWRPTPGE